MTGAASPAVWALGVLLAVFIALLVALIRRRAARRRFPIVFEAKVEHVCDGDSVWVRGRPGRVKLRLLGMDAPETEQPRGRESEMHLRLMLEGRRVTVRSVAADRYGRWVSTVTVEGVDAGLAMVARGEAWAYRAYLWALSRPEREKYLAAETRARRAGLGLWTEKHPEAPWLWRKRHRTILERLLDFVWLLWRRLFRRLGR